MGIIWTSIYSEKNTAVFIHTMLHSSKLKKFKHTNEELELAKQETENEKKKKELQKWYFSLVFSDKIFF